jgi:hypothetical protein
MRRFIPNLWLLLSLFLVLLLYSPSLLAARRPAAPNATFDDFIALDHQLTILDQQLANLKTTLQNAAQNTQQPRPWAQDARNLQPTVTAILRASYRLEHLYAPRESRLHRPLFRRLYRRAKTLRQDVRLLSQARTRRWARVVQARLSRAMVGYVFDYQLVSGGYAALRCQTDQTACCEPVRKDPHGPFSCRWACSQRASSCREGFPGPRVGPSYEQPLSASR